MEETNEQKAIAMYLAKPSLTNADIAKVLGVNPSSVSDYLKYVPGYKSAGNKKRGGANAQTTTRLNFNQ